VLHHSGQSARLAPARSFLLLQRSRFRLYSKWYSLLQRLLLEGITRAGMLYQMIFWLKQFLRGRVTWKEWSGALAVVVAGGGVTIRRGTRIGLGLAAARRWRLTRQCGLERPAGCSALVVLEAVDTEQAPTPA